jgi:hypothetical protein
MHAGQVQSLKPVQGIELNPSQVMFCFLDFFEHLGHVQSLLPVQGIELKSSTIMFALFLFGLRGITRARWFRKGLVGRTG